MDLIEIKNLLEAQGKAWEESKKLNDEIIKQKADGNAVAELEVKLAKVSAELDKLGEIKSQFEETLKQINRPFNETDAKSKSELEAEVKQFNMAMRADAQAKGKRIEGEMDSEGYLAYKSGFYKMVSGVSMDSLESNERKALLAGSDPDGGYLLPHSAVGRVVTLIREQSIMRQIASVQTISSNKIEGINDLDEADAGWVSEIGTRSDTDTPQVGKWEIECHEMYAQPKATQRILDDAAVDIEAWLAGKVADKFARVEGTAFWEGTGVGQARGLATYTTAATADASRAWGQFEHVLSGANGDFHTTQFDPLHTMMGAFKDHFLQNAQFVMRREVRTKARLLKESTTNRYLWEPGMQVGSPERLMGYPVRIDQYMPALATSSLSLAFGDFRQAYQIVDRIGIRTLRDPYTSKPYVKFYSTKRTGGGAINFEAVKFLKFAS